MRAAPTWVPYPMRPQPHGSPTPWDPMWHSGGAQRRLGRFQTAEEAALANARERRAFMEHLLESGFGVLHQGRLRRRPNKRARALIEVWI